MKNGIGYMAWIIAGVLATAGMARGQTTAKLALDQAAPEITATTLDDKPVTLAGLREAHAGRILIVQFASITDPIFRAHAAAVEKLAAKENEKAAFVIVYQKEAHTADTSAALELNDADGFNIAEPATLAEREKLAGQMVERLKIKNETVVVDAWNNASSQRYGSYPNMTFIIDAKGNLRAGYPFMDAAKVERAIDILSAGENRVLPPELMGPVQKGGPAPFDFASAAMDMTGGRGPATIAAILDRVQLTDQGRRSLLPALADFMADVQAFRQTRAAVPNLPNAGRGPRGNPPPNGAAPTTNAATGVNAEPKTIDDLQKAQGDLRDSAARLKEIIKQAMPEKDGAELIDALGNMAPAQRLFSGQN